jgi:hypothetical protein
VPQWQLHVPVLQEQLQERLSLVLVHSAGDELVDDRGDLEALVEDAALPLDAHILRPLHEAVEVTLGKGDTTKTCRWQMC